MITSNGYEIEIQYGLNQQRISQKLFSGTGADREFVKEKQFLSGLAEKTIFADNTTETINYITSPEGLTAIEVIANTGNREWYWVFTDHLGSITTLLRESDGQKFEMSYDAWGNRRDPATWINYTTTQPEFIIDRGFTGHEHLDIFGLINMNGRVYDPVAARFLSPDPYIQAPGMPQNYNGYIYCWNNPLKYVDPSGELIWLIPNIGWSKSGGLNIGLTFMVGMPGLGSAQASVGYSFKSTDFNASVGATALFNTVYASYSTQSGFSVGWTAGLSPQMGFPISTNFTSVGVNCNITHDSWSGSISAWQIDKNGMTFNPSVSVMILPEHTTNLVRGQGFRNNDAVLSRFVAAGNQQGALDHFGFEGTYDANKKNPGSIDINGNIYFNEVAFENGYHYLRSIAMEEKFHQLDLKTGNYAGVDWNDELQYLINHGIGEHKAKLYIYQRQGMFYKYKYSNLISDINKDGRDAGIYFEGNMSGKTFSPELWHFIYRIPRLW